MNEFPTNPEAACDETACLWDGNSCNELEADLDPCAKFGQDECLYVCEWDEDLDPDDPEDQPLKK